MKDSEMQHIEVDRLRVGMFVHLDVGWMAHPFPFGSFKIKTQEQIEIIKGLGVDKVRYSPRMSEVESGQNGSEAITSEEAQPRPLPAQTSGPPSQAEIIAARAQAAKRERQALLAEQHASLERCEHQFRDAARSFRSVLQCAQSEPEKACEEAQHVITGMLDEMSRSRETAIRLLSEKAGEESALHVLNVSVLSLLLGRACGLDEASLRHIGVGALLHDIGKLELPDRLRLRDPKFSAAERQVYETHVEKGVALAQRMQLSDDALAIISQHHEMDDGSGFPAGAKSGEIALGARVVALVNQYDNLCNPGNASLALTPHDALAVMFAKMRNRFDATTMATFIRMMGVYPPGSVIQLTDSRYAMSVSVNASRPLKPRVIVYDESMPPEEAIVMDLESVPEVGVRRSLKPIQLPRAVFDYLSPRKRLCYFFERSRDGGETRAAT